MQAGFGKQFGVDMMADAFLDFAIEDEMMEGVLRLLLSIFSEEMPFSECCPYRYRAMRRW